MVPAVRGKKHARFRAGIKKPAARWIFTDYSRNPKLWQPSHDAVPALSGVTRAIEIRMGIALNRKRNVGNVRVEGRGFDEQDAGLGGQPRRRDILPVAAVVARQMDGASARSGPDFGSAQGRGSNG